MTMMRSEQVARLVRPEGVGRCGQPLAADGRERVSVRVLLEWAFAREKAWLDFDDVGPAGSGGYDSTRGIMEAMALSTGAPGSCLRVDTSRGRSLPHHDAEIVAATLRSCVPLSIAMAVAELARNCRAPVWDLGPQRVVPVAWGRQNRFGRQGKTEVLEVCSYRSRRRGLVRREVLHVPVTIVPSASEIAAARRGWLDWWCALHALRHALQAVDLDLFSVTEALPAREPWKKG